MGNPVLSSSQANWPIPQEKIQELLPKKGWLPEYIAYASRCTDAPMAFHLGVGLSVLGAAMAHQLDIAAEAPRGSKILPTTMWVCLVGNSGSRKSYAMELGSSLYARAVGSTGEWKLPSDGSLQAWHDVLIDHPNIYMYRDEMSFLFSQARAGHMEGMKSWLMELYSGNPMSRTTRRRDSETGENEMTRVERPRLSLLGAIPPEVLRRSMDKGDYYSGFTARFMFYGGKSECYSPFPSDEPPAAMVLARALRRIIRKAQGPVVLPVELNTKIGGWVHENVLSRLDNMPPTVASSLVRAGEQITRIAAALCVSSLYDPDTEWNVDDRQLVIVENAVKRAIGLYQLVSGHMYGLIKDMAQEPESIMEMELIEAIGKCGPGWHKMPEIRARLPWGLRKTVEVLRYMGDNKAIQRRCGASTGPGRPSLEYSLLPPK